MQTYVNRCDKKEITYTVLAVEGDSVVVHSSNLDRNYTLSKAIFEDTMRGLGFTLQEDKSVLYRVFYINHNYYSDSEFVTCNQAINFGRYHGYEFRVELGDMICCAWDPITGLRFFAEYQRWAADQQVRLSQVGGYSEL